MFKKLTGVNYSPDEFRKRKICLFCGRATITENDMCDECILKNYKICDMCGIVLRKGTYTFYFYDNRDEKRENEFGFKINKSMIREFSYTVNKDNHNEENICRDCENWKIHMHNKCCECKKDFENTKENYKINGNMCPTCSIKYYVKN